LYPELNESGRGKEAEVGALVSTPGLNTLVTLGDGPIRGVFAATNTQLFVVSADKLYRIASDWTATELGTITSVAGRVSMADNGLQLVIVDGSASGWSYTFDGSTFQQIDDEDFVGASQVVYQDGYFIFSKPESGQFYISDLNGLGIDALDFASSEGNPDKIVGIISDHRELWVFNERTTEVFFNTGAAAFPFERVQGAFIEVGCTAPFSIAKMDHAVFWLGQDSKGQGIVYMAKGYQPQRISTHAVEQIIQRYAFSGDATAYTYQEGGHNFYVLNFPLAGTTWVFDSITNLWHERAFTNKGRFERHRGDCHAFAYNTHVVGDYATGKLYALSSNTFSDDGQEIRRRRVMPHVSSGGKRITYSEFKLDIETGVGIDGLGQGEDPKVMLQFSDDGGHTWSNEKWLSIGKIGNRHKRAIWHRLGSSRDRVFSVTISDPVRVTLLGADIEIEQAAS